MPVEVGGGTPETESVDVTTSAAITVGEVVEFPASTASSCILGLPNWGAAETEDVSTHFAQILHGTKNSPDPENAKRMAIMAINFDQIGNIMFGLVNECRSVGVRVQMTW